jgi:hypothetical protein
MTDPIHIDVVFVKNQELRILILTATEMGLSFILNRRAILMTPTYGTSVLNPSAKKWIGFNAFIILSNTPPGSLSFDSYGHLGQGVMVGFG